MKIKKKSLNFFVFIMLILTLVGCSVGQQEINPPAEKKEKLESVYVVEKDITNTENADKSITVSIMDKSIKEKEGMVILVHYNFTLPARSYIMYFNHDKSIPAKFYYPVEPIRMLYEDKLEYKDYKEELEKAYQKILKPFDLTNDKLFEMAREMYEKE